ncbi:hypothetical protein [Lysobacter capsici]|uniref:hypothetical protein n=1 Tax=Lysobacter capsici TaxID=435897 RepID=UPI0012FD81A7|nr:hypothetical protein [Lysobacter capsici]
MGSIAIAHPRGGDDAACGDGALSIGIGLHKRTPHEYEPRANAAAIDLNRRR